MSTLGSAGLHRVGDAGYAVAHSLFTRRSVACYSLLAIEDFARRQPQARETATQDLRSFVPACELLRTRYPLDPDHTRFASGREWCRSWVKDGDWKTVSDYERERVNHYA